MDIVTRVRLNPDLLKEDLNVQWEYHEFVDNNFCCFLCRRWYPRTQLYTVRIDDGNGSWPGEIAGVCYPCKGPYHWRS